VEKNKAYYRNLIKEKRGQIDLKHKKNMDSSIFQKIISSDIYKISRNIFIYVSFGMETDTHDIIEYSLKQGKSIYVPKVISRKEGMIALKISNLFDLKPNKIGILEPKLSMQSLSFLDIDLSIIPGVAFDIKGNRIGYGGGFYDRFLEKSFQEENVIAIAYDFQIFPIIPSEPYDIKIHRIYTEQSIYEI
jgi:5-formyltetrahydrofolate cyclo-ligase